MSIHSKNRRPLFFSVLGLVFVSCLAACHLFLRHGKVSGASRTTIKSELRRFNALLDDHLGGHWQLYSMNKDNELQEWQPTAAKAIFLVPEGHDQFSCVAAKKRARSKKKRRNSSKHRQFEFPGGKVDGKESPLLTLKRELLEEDSSSILNRVFAREMARTESQLYYRNIRLKNGEAHTLFAMPLKHEDWKSLHSYWKNRKRNKEVYGYSLVSLPDLDQAKKYLKLSWTPKSVKIIRSIFRK